MTKYQIDSFKIKGEIFFFKLSIRVNYEIINYLRGVKMVNVFWLGLLFLFFWLNNKCGFIVKKKK